MCDKNYPSHSIPGLEVGSIAFHTANGSLYKSSNCVELTNKPCVNGDSVKFSIRALPKSNPAGNLRVEVLFDLNDTQVGSFFTDLPPGGFYGVIGMMSKNEKIILSPPIASHKRHFDNVWRISTPQLISHKEDGICMYTGPGDSSDDSIGSVQTLKPIDPLGELSQRSFALRILNPGENSYIGMGIVDVAYPDNLLAGWEDSSIGYHADGGDVFQSSSEGFSTNHPCGENDVMRCVVQSVDKSPKQVRATFFKNSIKVSEVTAWCPPGGFYFRFGMMSKNEVVHVFLPEITVPYNAPKLQFEDVWEIANANIQLQKSGICHYVGSGSVGTIRSKDPIDPFGFANSYEVKILNSGEKCFIALGICSQQYSTDDLVGWDDLSVGYHADNGCILQKTGEEQSARNPSMQGDVIRCTVEPIDGSDKQMNVIFHKNDAFIGKIVFWKPSSGKVFAQIGCMSEGEVIQVASPLQEISHLQSDNVSTAITPTQSRASTKRLSGQDSTLMHTEAGAIGMDPGPPPSLDLYQNPEEMHRFWYHMYHHFHSVPHFRGHPAMHGMRPPPHPRAATFPRGGIPGYPTPAMPPFDFSYSYPPEFSPESQKMVQHQKSEPSPRGYYAQTSVSSSPTSVPSHFSSQTSMSSQVSVSSLDSVPEGYEQESSILNRPTQLVSLGASSQRTGLVMSPVTIPNDQSTHGSSLTLTTPSPAERSSVRSSSISSTPLLQRSSSLIIEPKILSKEENRTYKILHNASMNEDGSLQYVSLNPESSNAFIMFRTPLSEKLNYYQIEILELNQESNIAVGLVWDHYPVYRLPGALEGSIAFHTKSHSVLNGKESNTTDWSCDVGDIIGCKAFIRYKSEVTSEKKNVKIEFYKNGVQFHSEEVYLPPSGFYPAVGVMGIGTKVNIDQNIQLTPLSYFATHPLPPNFSNFELQPQIPVGWQCLQSSRVQENYLYMSGECCGKPAVIQNFAPFSNTSTFFQVKLLRNVSSYSVLSIGAVPKLPSDIKIIPGESSNSIGFSPLLGFIMSKGRICVAIHEVVSSELYKKNTTIGVGIEFINDYDPLVDAVPSKKTDEIPSLPAESSEKVRIFFTVNSQQVNSTLIALPKGGFYPTLAIESDCRTITESLARIEFPKQFPCIDRLPLGFARGPDDGFILKFDPYTVQDKRLDAGPDTETVPVRALQAAQPLTPSRPYFEVRIFDGGSTFKISCGVASLNYPLDAHPGWKNNSIAFHADDGRLFLNGSHSVVVPPPRYNGALMGCGARFPKNNACNYAEVFFTLNRKFIVSKLVKVPQMGLFPTIGMRTKGGIITVNLRATVPLADMTFKTSLGIIQNIKIEESIIELISPSNPGALQVDQPWSLHEPHYFTVDCLNEKNGRIMIGFSTSESCPLNFLKFQSLLCYVVDIVSGKLMIYNQYFKTKETCPTEDSVTFGIGIRPHSGFDTKYLFYFTANDYVVLYLEVEIEEDHVYPCVLMMDSTTKLKLDMCSVWPSNTPIGCGWARHSNVKVVDSMITHSSAQIKKRLPVGFAQSSLPLTSIHPYFEIDICSRTANKAIAIGLASRSHPLNMWIGWSKGSIGYHADDGRLFKESSFGQSYGPRAYTGDTIGCGARFKELCYSDMIGCSGKAKLEVFFTINGEVMNGHKVSIPSGGFFPTICLESPTESVIFHCYRDFPSVPNLVNSKEWGRAYCVKQIGRTITNCCQRSGVSSGNSSGFCQAAKPFSAEKPYFQVEIVSFGSSSKGCIEVGAAARIPAGCIVPNTQGIFYKSSGHVIVKRGSQRSSTEVSKFNTGDVTGCAVIYENGKPEKLDFYVKHTKVFSTHLDDQWKTVEFYPTIVLSQSGESVIPSLEMDIPVWDHSFLIGWLRSERVKIHTNIIEYIGDVKISDSVGVAQISQVLKPADLGYYEVEIFDPGEKCLISVGAAPPDYPLNMHPGWCKKSVGYHGDDGRLFVQSGVGVPFASNWKQHDVIGLGVRSPPGDHLPDRTQVFFTKNGIELGHTTISLPDNGLFPTIGLHSAGEKVKVSLGQPSTLPFNHEPLRTQWQVLSGIHLEKSFDGIVLKYKQLGRLVASPGFLISLAIYGQPFSDALQYFETEILSVGSIGIGIGVAPENYSLEHAPGWSQNSVAYHTDDGKLYNQSVKGKLFGPIVHPGDIVGCGITFIPNNKKFCSVFFTHNGVEIGRVKASLPNSGLFPAFALTDPKDNISIKFLETFKPKTSQSDVGFVGLMRINNCSYSEQIVHFKGSGHSVCVSPAVAQFAMPLSQDQSYYATSIVECNDGILIGLAVKDYPLRYAPGTTSISIAYDTLKGCIRAVYNSDNFYSIDAPICVRGDNVGCGINFSTDSKTKKPFIFYTRNGTLVQTIDISDDILLSEELYPIIAFVPHNKSSSVFMDWNVKTYEWKNEF